MFRGISRGDNMTMTISTSITLYRKAAQKLLTALKLFRGVLYQKQVTFRLATASMHEGPGKIRLPSSYTLRSVGGPEDNPAWIALLNKDAGFGHWNEERLQSEIRTNLVAENAAGFLFKDGQLIGSAAVCFSLLGGKRVPTGMYLIMDPAYRGNLKIAKALLQYNFWLGLSNGHRHVYATTDPSRLPALMLYLSNGAEPCHTNLWSFVQWRRINKRLGATVDRISRRQST